MAPISYQDFLSTQVKEDYPAAPEQLSALRTLFADPSVPVSQVAEQIARPIVEARQNCLENPEAPDEYRYGILWRTIADAVRQLTEYNDRLVKLVVEIQKVPDPEGYIAFMQDFQEHWTEFAFDCKSRLAHCWFQVQQEPAPRHGPSCWTDLLLILYSQGSKVN